jgi:hypothetical protein
MTPREAIQEALRYMSHPNRIVETMEIREGLRKTLAELPMSEMERNRHEKMCDVYQARKRIPCRPPTEVYDEA